MKKVLSVCVVVSLFIACSKKDIQKWMNKPGNPKPSVPCKIDSIYPVEKGHPAAVGWTAVGIHYNDKGYPTVVNYEIQGFSHVGPKFSTHYKYDSKNRLTEVISPYVDPVDQMQEHARVIKRHKFVYEGNAPLPIRDSIISDTVHSTYGGTPHQIYSVRVEDLYYDQQGRINRVVTRGWFHNTLGAPEPYPDHEVKFSYDANGNRQVVRDRDGSIPTAISYTNKPSLYSLHPVWQLIHKNWSKNAVPENVINYNSHGLPTRLEGWSGYETFLNARISPSAEDDNLFNIKYTCF